MDCVLQRYDTTSPLRFGILKCDGNLKTTWLEATSLPTIAQMSRKGLADSKNSGLKYFKGGTS